ncbi:MAG: hypothetical protein JST14_03455 [Bacteroidetes bacterium]|nr:hypothetical protein [Bacteroidota bacterium]MBS1979182.1 hypothetical protein [Bacteroidota bacterium]
MSSNIVHQYFKKDTVEGKILVKLNPIQLKGTELFVPIEGPVEARDLTFDEHILEDLAADGFEETGPMEFGLYQTGLAR